MRSLTYVEIDIPAFVQNSPPDSPLPMTTFRFSTDVDYLPSNISAIPSIISVKITPGTISLGEDLGQRTTVEVRFRDHKHIFASESFDSGTFWGKFRGRYGLKLRGYSLRVIVGAVGDALQDMETRNYIIESTDGPTAKGEYKIIAKDVLKFADGDRAQAPALSPGFLLADLTSTVGNLTLSPTGAGDSYGPSGFAAIGGKEIVRFHRLGYDEFDVLLVHADSSSPDQIIDALDTPHTITRVGTINPSTAQSKFGGSSIQFGGGYLQLDGSSDFAFGSEDFTVEFWVRRNATGSTHNLYDSRPSATNGAYLRIQIRSDNVLEVFVNSVGIAGGGALSANQWYHAAVTRASGIMRVFLDGVQLGSNVADSTVYLNPANRPIIGADGNSLGGNPLSGFMDEIKITKGVARYVQAFTPPTAAYSLTGSGDVLWIVRAQYNTLADTHRASDRVQLCLEYLSEDVADLIYDLLVTYASVDPSFVTLANWQTETSTYLNTHYSSLIAEPTAVADLVSELIEQATLAMWWDDVEEQIRLQVLRSISTTADTFDEDVMMEGTLEVQEQPQKRVSQVYTYFNRINPLVNLDQIDNYASTTSASDTASEAEYGSASIKKIFSRWIPAGGRAVADALNDIILARFVTPPRRISFDVLRGSTSAPQLGLGYQVMGWPFQEQDGSDDSVPVQIVSLNPRADVFEVEAEEVFAGTDVVGSSPDRHTILIDANVLNVNLRTIHDSLYAAPTSGITVDCTILDGIIVGSSITSSPAFDVGTWPGGVTVNLTVIGRIEGKGGAGGTGGRDHFAGSNGSVGGAATLPGGSGAAAGSSIDGVSFVTTVGGAGDRRGSQVN